MRGCLTKEQVDVRIRKVRKKFPGSGWFDGVIIESVEDGRCKIAWSDGAVTSMKVSAVAKILQD